MDARVKDCCLKDEKEEDMSVSRREQNREIPQQAPQTDSDNGGFFSLWGLAGPTILLSNALLQIFGTGPGNTRATPVSLLSFPASKTKG